MEIQKKMLSRLELNWMRLVSIIAILFAMVASIWYFFNIIALGICAAFIIFHRDLRWKLHGVVIAFFSGLATFISINSTAPPPLDMTVRILFPGIGAYILILILLRGCKEMMKKRGTLRASKALNFMKAKIPLDSKAFKALLIIIGIIIPIGFWGSVNINVGVMFNNQPKMLWIHAPTTPEINTPFELSVQAWDAYERVSASYLGKVEFALESYSLTDHVLINPSLVVAALPEQYSFTGQKPGHITDTAYLIMDGKDNGKKTFQATITTPGIHYVKVRDVSDDTINLQSKIPHGNSVFYSNPIIVYPNNEEYLNIYWGDIHTHSILSDGAGSVEHNAFYARHVAKLDYYSLTDHSEIMYFQPWTFKIVEDSTNNAYEPGKFVAFQGIEWTNLDYGHHTLVFSGDSLLHPPDLMPGRFGFLSTTERLWQDLDEFTEATGSKAIALPHHTTKESYAHDWSYTNPKYVRLAEVASTHGDFLYPHDHPLNYRGATGKPKEYTHGTSINDGLTMGHRLTLYAASDVHSGHPGHAITHSGAAAGHQRPLSAWATRTDKPYPGGITAVFAKELTRDSVFDALYNTRVYANSDHGRPLLQFSVNEVTVGDGSFVQVDSPNSPRTLKILVAQDGSPAGSLMTSATSLVSQDWAPNWNAVIEILKNGELLHSKSIDTPIFEYTFIDNEPITGASYDHCIERNGEYFITESSVNPVDPSTLNTDSDDFYIVRIVGQNGRHSYAGAIWVGY